MGYEQTTDLDKRFDERLISTVKETIRGVPPGRSLEFSVDDIEKLIEIAGDRTTYWQKLDDYEEQIDKHFKTLDQVDDLLDSDIPPEDKIRRIKKLLKNFWQS